MNTNLMILACFAKGIGKGVLAGLGLVLRQDVGKGV